MRMNLMVPVSAMLTFAAVAPRAVAQDAVKDAKEALQTALYDLADKESVIVSFRAGSSKLTSSQVSELRTTYNAFKDDAKVKEIVVVSYSDKPYPRSTKKNLAKADRNLAASRGDVVKKELSKFGGKNIKVYNVAESANWFERFLVTSDAQVKQEAKEQPADQTREDAFFESLGRHLVTVGGPGKVVVVMRHETNSVSH